MRSSRNDTVSLREYLEVRIDNVEKTALLRASEQEKAVAAALAEQKGRISEANIATEKRFEGVNEFRNSLSDQARLFMPRIESERMHEAALDRHNIANAAMLDRVDRLALRMTAYDERDSGKTIGWSAVVSVIALIASVIGVLAFFLK